MSRLDQFTPNSYSVESPHSAYNPQRPSLPKPQNFSIPENQNIQEIMYIQRFTCKICQEDKQEVFRIPRCHHIYCLGCISDYITFRIQEAQVSKIPCPDHECESEIIEEEIKNLISDTYYEKYKIFKRNNELSNNPFLRWCPKPDCTGFDLGNISKDHLTCTVCSFEYCYYCGESWHTTEKCQQKYDRDLDEWGKKNDLRFCTNCRIKVVKAFGCDHMVCPRCSFQWCWLCGEEFNEGHMPICRVYKLSKWDKPLFRIFQFIFSPITLLLLPIFIFTAFVYETDAGFANDAKFLFIFFKRRTFVYLFAIFSGILMLPFYMSLGPIAVGVVIVYKFLSLFSFHKWVLVLASILFGSMISPLVPSVALVVVLGMIVYGFFFLVIKIAICSRRCFNPNYMIVHTKYRPL